MDLLLSVLSRPATVQVLDSPGLAFVVITQSSVCVYEWFTW